MKKLIPLVLVLALAACHKKEAGERSSLGGLPGLATMAMTKYSGTIDDVQTMSIPVTIKVNTTDVAFIYLCMGVTCDADNLPALSCPVVGHAANFAPGWQSTAVCYQTSPCPYITSGDNVVQLTNEAYKNGFRTYSIKAYVTQ